MPLRSLVRAGRLLPGDWVEVRSEAAILATLDGDGTLDHLPFMPEMRRFLGRRLQVKTRADRTVAEGHGVRSMVDTVHLDGAYCDGGAHDACDRACLLFWKEAWLQRVDGPHADPPPVEDPPSFRRRTTKTDGEGYFCQATQLHRASKPLPVYHLRPHADALRSEEIGALQLGHSFVILAHDLVQERILGGRPWAVVPGKCRGRTPSVSLGLTAGERVRVKRVPEILATLDRNGKNRGLEFSREMLRYCGREHTVLRRCERFIRDDPPVMVELKDTVILEGLAYRAMSRLAIPRGEFFFWRECWLERVDERASPGA